MLKHRWTDRICCILLAFSLLLTAALTGIAGASTNTGQTMGYEKRLFDQSKVHEIEIIMDDWEGFLETCTNEEYTLCTVIIDGEVYKNVGIRAKGNTSLSSVRSYGNDRYSFNIEFDHYNIGESYHGLDKLSLNNLIQDNTLMKDYLAYTLMNEMGVAAPLCSYASISVNGEAWGLYLAVEAVEDAFLQRNYGSDYGELYKPDSMSFGGGRGNGKDFNMDDFADSFEGEGNMFPQMPEGGMDFPQNIPFGNGGQMPESGMDFPQNMPFGQDGGMPPFGVPNAEASHQAEDKNSESGDTSRQNGKQFGGDRGGFGGMGSSDVKLQYTDDNPDSYSNIFSNAKTDITEADKNRLIGALKALDEGNTSAVDTDAVIRYLVVHNFMCNGDSYTGSMVHNYYLHEDDGVLSMIPWDYNLSLGSFSMGQGSDGTSIVNSPIDSPVSGGDIGDRPMVAWIFEEEEYLQQYHDTYADFIAQISESGWLAQKIDDTIALLSPYVENDPTAFCSFEEFQKGVQTLREFCLLRCDSISGQLNGSIPSTAEAQNEGSESLIDASHLILSDMGGMGKGGMGFGGKGGQDIWPGNRTAGKAASSMRTEAALPGVTTQAADTTESEAARMPSMLNHSSAQPKLSFTLIISVVVLLLAILILWRSKGRTS